MTLKEALLRLRFLAIVTIEHGSENALYELGLAKTEGKKYIVKDGDCIFFKFNV